MATWQRLCGTICHETDDQEYYIVIFNEVTQTIFVLNPIGLYQYEFNTDSWKRHCVCSNALTDDFFRDDLNTMMQDHPAVINPNTNTLYFLNYIGMMAILKINIDIKSKWITKDKMINTNFGSQGIIINDKYHIIGGYDNSKHLCYNVETNQFEELHDLKHVMNLTDFIYYSRWIKMNKHQILMFGGRCITDSLDTVFEYNALQNKWIKINAKLPQKLSSFGCVSILYNQYVILFGGRNKGYDHVNDIWIYSVCDRIFTKSSVKCPEKGRYRAFAINDRKKDEIITSGYVTDTWRKYDMDDHMFLSQDVIWIIHKYYLNEWIHLFRDREGGHWKINVFDWFVIDNL